jgi:hypothetical protein
MRTQILAQLPNTDATRTSALYDVYVEGVGTGWGDYAYCCTYSDLVEQLEFADRDPSIVAVRVDRTVWPDGIRKETLQFHAQR